MRRVTLLLAAALLGLSALLPVTALAAGSLTEYVAGVEYAAGSPCGVGGTTGSFAGVASATQGGSLNAFFNTTICHSDLSRGSAQILGGSFQLATSQLLLVGRYTGGSVALVSATPGYFCKQVFHVIAHLAPVSPPSGATSINGGAADGLLTHYGVTTSSGCRAYAATITGVANLTY